MTVKNELIPLLHQIGLLRAIVLYKTDGNKIISQLHSNNYSFWSYIDNYLAHGHVLLRPDGSTNHHLIYKWEELDANNT